MAQPVVSIVMPCYNDGRYIREAVDSCFAQTFKDLELLIVDDGSTDRETIAVLRELADLPDVTLLHTAHEGPAGARNAAIRAAQGRYILPLDADDMILPPYVAQAAALLDERPEVGVATCKAELFGRLEGRWNLPDYDPDRFLVGNCIFVTSMFRKADWEAVGGFSTAFKHGLEDYDFWLSLVERGRQVYCFPDVWFRYRIKNTSRSTVITANLDYQKETYQLLFDRHRDLYLAHIDAYCTLLRNEVLQLENQAGIGAAETDDPVVSYWLSLRRLKPRAARAVERLLGLKDRLKKLLKRGA